MVMRGGEPFFLPGNSIGCLLIHGFVSTPQEMQWLGKHLNQAGFTILGIRLHGHSTRASDLYHARWHDWVASIEDGYHLLKGECDEIVVIGMSLGGALALVSSTTLGFACAVTISTPYHTIPHPKIEFLERTLPLMGLAQTVIKFLPKPPPLDFHDKQAAEDHLTYSNFPTRGVLESHDLLTQMRVSLPQLNIPVLVIHSRQDRGVPIENAQRLINALKLSRVHSLFVERSGHVVLLEPERERAAEAIVHFISESTGYES